MAINLENYIKEKKMKKGRTVSPVTKSVSIVTPGVWALMAVGPLFGSSYAKVVEPGRGSTGGASAHRTEVAAASTTSA